MGNKNDDPERKVVETEDAYKFAGQMGIQLFETSAKENVNVEEVSSAAPRAEGQVSSCATGPPHHRPAQASQGPTVSAHCWLAAGQTLYSLAQLSSELGSHVSWRKTEVLTTNERWSPTPEPCRLSPGCAPLALL